MSRLLNYKNQNLTIFPDEILTHKEITNLNLEDNSIDEIPEWIKELKNLKVLYLSNNQISDFSSLCAVESLEVVHLNSNRVKKIPLGITQLKNLKRLYLNNNLISKVEDSVGGLTELNRLLLAKNQINSISNELCNLKKLHVLNLFDNELTSLPDLLGQMRQLDYLQISKNYITKLPDSIEFLNHLTSLKLFSNKIVELNSGLKELSKLKNLNIGDNQVKIIANIPVGIKRLSIYNNPVTEIEGSILTKFKENTKSDCLEYLFIDNHQSNNLDLKKSDFGKSLKIVDLDNRKIHWSDHKHMPFELQETWRIKREKIRIDR